jgi:snoRNA binding domain, fibrillarin
VGAALVVAHGDALYLLRDAAAVRRFSDAGATFEGPPGANQVARALPSALIDELRRLGPAEPILAGGPALADSLATRLGRPVARADRSSWHEALRKVPPADPASERARFLERARADLDSELRSPAEVLISLAREEERLERSVGREQRAAEAFVAVPGTVLAEHARSWSRGREAIAAQHRELVGRLEVEARRTVPNLSAVVGPRTAARLVAAAGGVLPLARISASRLQLLGSRRRPNPEHGPRFGAIYLADGLDTVPQDRRGAFARSLAALAAVAARADALTRADVAARLLRRRELRLQQLRRGRR